MKKIITFCFFAFALVLGTQNAVAQNKLEINKVANEKAYELRKELKFSDDALEETYQAYREKALKEYSLAKHDGVNTPAYAKNMATVEAKFSATMESVLTEEQYKRFTIINESK
ncbi:hypothetical protein ES677_13975 [Bizionia gelidisalsuginis]|uniref:DUF4168 domain-containing protein n=2 Tax=Bizionia TaxID=283785 RepID=A0A8H2LDS2_9FLAO|nr:MULTISPECIES: hypothetical protein [Bizionia]TYB72505.1 hypothetical protein ES676_11080 [Bizionia saleffrena]TYC08780.1 hypothetical protein ES677_13975 [Bizionia gelidisalsuginis]